MAIQFPIIDGPSKMDLMLALFDGHMGRRTVVFHVQSRTEPVEVIINEVGQEDGSCESWLFKGWTKKDHNAVKGWFRTDRRAGWLETK
jgi:hypothetical protein